MIKVIFNLGGIIMRKLIYFGIAAIAAISLSSCQKEADFQDPSDNLVSVTFRAEKAGETRTAAVEGTSSVSYVWTAEDKDNFKLLQVTTDADNKEHFTEVPNPTLEFSSDMKVLTIKADVPEGSTLRAIVANEWTGSEGEDTRKPKVKSTQNPLADNFDPTADILVSEDEEIPEGETEIEGTFIFNRPVTVNKMTLKQMVEGEKVNKVVISSDENLIGYYNGSSMAGQTQGNVITLKYDDIAVGSTGEFPVYFITIPAQRNNLVVRVYTDKYTYMKSFGTVNFTNGKFSSFGLKLEGYGKPVVDTDFSGEWVITGNNNGLFAAKAFESGNSNLKALPVKMDISKKSIKATDVDVIKMTFTKITEGDYNGFYTIQDANGLYLKAASKDANQLKADEMTEASADYYWKVSDTGDGSTTIIAEKSENRNIMRFNSSSSLFSCYTSGQNAVTIYPYSWVSEDTDVVAPAGSGTVEDPFNVAAAIDEVKDLTWTSNTEYEATDEVYVKGKISRIASKGTYTEGGDFGNASFYISDDGTAANEFYCYRSLYLGNKKYQAGQTDIKVGDEVVVHGKLMNYKGNTPETVANAAYLYSLNGVIGETTPSIVPDKSEISVSSDEETVTVALECSNLVDAPAAQAEVDWITVNAIDDTHIEFVVSANTGNERSGVITISAQDVEDVELTVTQAAYSEEPQDKTIVIDGSQFTSTATTEEVTKTFGNVPVVFSSGAKQQSSTGDNKFTDKAILIGKLGAYIYNSDPIPGTITKFEIYANKGASAKVSVGVNFSDSPISAYDSELSSTYTATLSTLDSVYDCSDKLPEGAKYFWYQVTNANNSQIEIRITYTPSN
jgi:hypothetical protein